MGDVAVEIGEKELIVIGEYVKSHLPEWNDYRESSFSSFGERDLYERILRVEETLRSHIELTRRGFEQVDKRFEQVDKRFEQVDKRFEQVDKRFEDMNKRFEDMNRRFNQLQVSMAIGTTLIAALIGIMKIF